MAQSNAVSEEGSSNDLPSASNTQISTVIPLDSCAKVYVQRDYTRGLAVRFSEHLPPELAGYVEPRIWQNTTSRLNTLYAEAEKVGPLSAAESILGCASCYLSAFCMRNQYRRRLDTIERFIQDENSRVYIPLGLHLTDPVQRGLRVLEVSILVGISDRVQLVDSDSENDFTSPSDREMNNMSVEGVDNVTVIDANVAHTSTPVRHENAAAIGTIFNNVSADDDNSQTDNDAGCEFASHCHPRRKRKHDNAAIRALTAVSAITVVFIGVQVTGGYLADSLAIMTDAFHMLTDLLSFVISLSAIGIARRSPTKRFSFGFYRAEVLGALCSVLIIWVLTGILVYLAVQRCIHQQFEVDGFYMLITAVLGLFFNLCMMVTLHMCGHGHSHHAHNRDGHAHEHNVDHVHADVADGGHDVHEQHNGVRVEEGEGGSDPNQSSSSSSPSNRSSMRSLHSALAVNIRVWDCPSTYPGEPVLRTKRTDARAKNSARDNINVRAAYVHAISDAVQSAGVVVAALVIYFWPQYQLADPICTFIFSLLVLVTTKNIFKDSILVLMEATPSDVSYAEVQKDLESVPGVVHAHSLHLWSLTTNQAALAVHLAIEPSTDPIAVMRKARGLMLCKYNLSFTTVQVEPYDPVVMSQCEQCLGPDK